MGNLGVPALSPVTNTWHPSTWWERNGGQPADEYPTHHVRPGDTVLVVHSGGSTVSLRPDTDLRHRHAVRVGRYGAHALYLLAASSQVAETLLEGGGLSEPDALPCLLRPGFVVNGHHFQASALRGVDLAAAHAGMLVDAGGAVGAVAVAEGDLAQQEVLLEVVPLIRAGYALLFLGACTYGARRRRGGPGCAQGRRRCSRGSCPG